ncbi:MAG: hypothetical protein P8Z30_15270, partial [Acidobacteriota bacterium]
MVSRKFQQGSSGTVTFSRRQFRRARERVMLLGLAVALAAVTATTGCFEQSDEIAEAEPRIAPLLKGLGTQTHPVTTSSPLVRQAALLDPNCAMAYWGQALALGPNINAPMSAEHGRQAYDSIRLASTSKASAKERAYLPALARRYSRDENQDRKALDKAYADAMRDLAKRYPQDDDVQTLFAAALMNLRPWDTGKKMGDRIPRPRKWFQRLKPFSSAIPATLAPTTTTFTRWKAQTHRSGPCRLRTACRL